MDKQSEKKPAEYAASLCMVAEKFMALNFPDHSWRVKFGAFQNGAGRLPDSLRLKYVGELAMKEGLDKKKAQELFEQYLPVMSQLFSEHGNDRRVYEELLEVLRDTGVGQSHQWPKTTQDLVELCLTYLVILDGTSDVERCFKTVQTIEQKRYRHLSETAMKDALQIALEVPRNSHALVIKGPPALEHASGQRFFLFF